MILVNTKKSGWMQVRFRCSKNLQGIERDVLRAAVMIVAGNGRLFADWEDKDSLGYASANQIANFLDMELTVGGEHFEKNLHKIRMVLKFLRERTWVKLHYVARSGKSHGATRIFVSKACYRLKKLVLDSGKKLGAIYNNHIWGSGVDFTPKPLETPTDLVPDGWKPPGWMAGRLALVAHANI